MSKPRLNTNARMAGGAAQRTDCPRILAVDDVQDNLDLTVELFEGEPWSVRTADNAPDAWAMIKRWRPDLVLLDVQMPELNGHHLCTAIRMKPELDDVQVVFLTAERTSPSDIARGLEMGAADYLCKPIDAKTLRERVRAVIVARVQRTQDDAT